MRILDLFAGLRGWSAPFLERGHDVTTLDFNPRFECDFTLDILRVADLGDLERRGGRFDVVLASPPCQCFSIMTVYRHWRHERATGRFVPKTDAARHAILIAERTFGLIDRYAPAHYVIENPRGMMRRVSPRPPSATTWYCRWGMPYAKPTDVWTSLRGAWPACRNGALDHEYAPRGSKTGVQADAPRLRSGRNTAFTQLTGARAPRREWSGPAASHREKHSANAAALRALIPYAMADAVRVACETGGAMPPVDDRQLTLLGNAV